MKKILFLILLGIILGNEIYEGLINETVSEECNFVISNLTALLNEGYVYLDFLKAPSQPEGKEDYVVKVDLISELNQIKKTDRTFYDFYSDIQNVINKARDGHLTVKVSNTPNKFPLEDYNFCLPFIYEIKEIFNEENKVIDTYITIVSLYGMFCSCSSEIMFKTMELQGKKILKINGLDPYEYFEKMSKKGPLTHSLQSQFIDILDSISGLGANLYLLKEEDLKVSIQFEGEENEFEVEYQFEKSYFLRQESNEYNSAGKETNFKNDILLPRFKEMIKQFKDKNELINKKNLEDEYEEEDGGEEEEKKEEIWQLKDYDEKIKCRVDEKNQFNVLYQRSFSPNDFDNYEDIMYKCFSLYYSNNYKLIIIEDRNNGGKTELCYPCAQYVCPKVLKPTITTLKSTPLLLETFFLTDEMLNPETCFPYTEKDNILDGKEEIYSDGIDTVIHKKTKEIDSFNIYEKKLWKIKE